MAAQILIVEDEKDLLEVLEHRLNKEGYETLGFLSTKNVRQAIAEEKIDLIIMDRNLPDIEGSEFIALLRDQGMEIPVIYLSAKGTKYHIEEGFLRGADDYITKPFEMQELFYRIQAVLRRTQASQQASTVTFRDIELDLRSLHRVDAAGQRLDHGCTCRVHVARHFVHDRAGRELHVFRHARTLQRTNTGQDVGLLVQAQVYNAAHELTELGHIEDKLGLDEICAGFGLFAQPVGSKVKGIGKGIGRSA